MNGKTFAVAEGSPTALLPSNTYILVHISPLSSLQLSFSLSLFLSFSFSLLSLCHWHPFLFLSTPPLGKDVPLQKHAPIIAGRALTAQVSLLLLLSHDFLSRFSYLHFVPLFSLKVFCSEFTSTVCEKITKRSLLSLLRSHTHHAQTHNVASFFSIFYLYLFRSKGQTLHLMQSRAFTPVSLVLSLSHIVLCFFH